MNATASLLIAAGLLVAHTLELGGVWVPPAMAIGTLLIFALAVTEIALGFRAVLPAKSAPGRRIAVAMQRYLRRNILSSAMLLAFLVLLIYDGVANVGGGIRSVYLSIAVVRSLVSVMHGWRRLGRLSEFFSSVIAQPAQTIVLSFVAVIVVGALLLMMPFATPDRAGLTPINALFTATSAVCVTGLIVVDTATALTTAGQVVVLGLIQIGGLGIMILSFFVVFAFGRQVSVENKMMVSYMLSENNMSALSRSLSRIVLITLAVEAVGAAALYPMFRSLGAQNAGFHAGFHAVSAFCNAGFALHTTSFEQFAGAGGLNLVISALVITGGLSFAVLVNVASTLGSAVRGRRASTGKRTRLTPAAKAILLTSGALLVAGTLIFYALEHGNTLAPFTTSTQYLVAFFQSMTTRTAGFNTVPIGNLLPATKVLMLGLMFVGGASGSTAGGLKVNTVAVMYAYLHGLRKGRRQTLLFRHVVPEQQVATAFTVLVFGVGVVFAGTLILSISESFALSDTLFEVVSAFATVGLSTGITSALSIAGKMTIVAIMFVGRVGPLTLFSALSSKHERARVSYPTADITIG